MLDHSCVTFKLCLSTRKPVRASAETIYNHDYNSNIISISITGIIVIMSTHSCKCKCVWHKSCLARLACSGPTNHKIKSVACKVCKALSQQHPLDKEEHWMRSICVYAATENNAIVVLTQSMFSCCYVSACAPCMCCRLCNSQGMFGYNRMCLSSTGEVSLTNCFVHNRGFAYKETRVQDMHNTRSITWPHVGMFLPQCVFVYNRTCSCRVSLSTKGNNCLPQGMFVYHRSCLSRRECLSTTGNVCLPQGVFVYVVLMCMLAHLLPCPLARRTHLWTGTAGIACSERCQAEAWPAGIHLGCRSADTRAALLHHHVTAGAAPEPGRCVVNSQQIHSFVHTFVHIFTHSFIHSFLR